MNAFNTDEWGSCSSILSYWVLKKKKEEEEREQFEKQYNKRHSEGARSVGTCVSAEHLQNYKYVCVTNCQYQALIHAGYHCEYIHATDERYLIFCSTQFFVHQWLLLLLSRKGVKLCILGVNGRNM